MKTQPVIKTICLAIFCAAMSVAADTPLADRLSHIAPLSGETPAGGHPVRLALPRGIIAGTSNRFADLRLLDDLGRETPFVVMPEAGPKRGSERIRFHPTAFDDKTRTITLDRGAAKSGPYDRLEVKTSARDFNISVTVSGSDDGRVWRELCIEPMFDFSASIDLRKTLIELPLSDHRYLRLKLADGDSEPGDGAISLKYRDLEFSSGTGRTDSFRVDGITTWLALEPPEAAFDRATIANPPQRGDGKKNTLIELGEVNLPLAGVRLTVGSPYFSRRIEVQTAEKNMPDLLRPKPRQRGGRWGHTSEKPNTDPFHTRADGVIYRFPGMARDNTDLTCDLPQSRMLRLSISDGDSPPLDVESIELRWVRLNLYFVPEPGRHYELRFGGPGLTAPAYDLASLLPPEAAMRGLSEWSAGEVRQNPHFRPPKEVNYGRWAKTALYSIMSLLAAGLAFWLYSLARRLQPPGSAAGSG